MVKVLLELSVRGSYGSVARNAKLVRQSPVEAWLPLGYRTPRSSGEHGPPLGGGEVQALQGKNWPRVARYPVVAEIEALDL